MTRMDYVTFKLINIGESKFVEEVLKLHKIMKYDEVPQDVADTVADIFEERVKEIEEEEV